ncbi:MAG TPA: copper transporter, partial [Solirubrobacterales bacterium]|nr:copper transporter [Solirubrobacterales bacterium]
MGYSARYHAASLAAVFLALAVGILIGVGFGSDIVSGTAEDLEQSLEEDLDQERAQVDALEDELADERAFERAVYPAVVENVLRGSQVALIGLGDVSAEITADLEEAIGPTGGEIGEVGVVTEPPDLDRLAQLEDGRMARAIERGSPDALRELGVDAARLLVHGGLRFDELRGTLLGRYSGQAAGTDAVVLVRERPEDLEPEASEATDALEDG